MTEKVSKMENLQLEGLLVRRGRYAWRRPFGGGGAAFVRSTNRASRSNEPRSNFRGTTESYSEKWSSMELGISPFRKYFINFRIYLKQSIFKSEK